MSAELSTLTAALGDLVADVTGLTVVAGDPLKLPETYTAAVSLPTLDPSGDGLTWVAEWYVRFYGPATAGGVFLKLLDHAEAVIGAVLAADAPPWVLTKAEAQLVSAAAGPVPGYRLTVTLPLAIAPAPAAELASAAL